MSIPNERLDMGCDFYLTHMTHILEWIDHKICEAEEMAKKDPSLRTIGYEVDIRVESRWLKQLIIESMEKHQMLRDMQRRITDIACATIAVSPRSIFMNEEKER